MRKAVLGVGGALLTLLAAGFGCMPQPVKVVPGVVTKVERTTVTVRDPDGKVIRIEEKETVLQDYLSAEPVRLKTVGAPAPVPPKSRGE